MTALYEIVPVGAQAAEPAAGRGAEPLKYQPAAPAAVPTAQDKPPFEQVGKPNQAGKPAARRPGEPRAAHGETPLEEARRRHEHTHGGAAGGAGGGFDAAPADFRFAAAVAAFGMILRESDHKGTATLPLVAEIAGSAMGRDPGGYRAEFLDLVRKAEGDRGIDR